MKVSAILFVSFFFNWKICFAISKGIRLKGNKWYTEVEDRLTYYMKILTRATFFLLSALGIFPFVRVACDCCLGKYTTDSWIFLFKFWWLTEMSFHRQVYLHLFRICFFHRTPFDLNSTFRCFSMAVAQGCVVVYGMLVVATILTFFIGITMYTEAILNDIMSIFNRMDNSLKSKDKPAVLQYCKEAIDLHARIYRCEFYKRFHDFFFPSHNFKSIIWYYSQLYEATGRRDESDNFY